MQTLRVRTRSNSDRVVHLNIPVETPDAAYEVLVIVQPQAEAPAPTPPKGQGWPAGFFEATAGAWKGEFVRDQGTFLSDRADGIDPQNDAMNDHRSRKATDAQGQ